MTTTVLKILFLIAILAPSSWAQGESNCAALIQQGLYDTYSESTSSSSYLQMVANFCGSYSQYLNNQYASSSGSDYSDSDSSIHGSSNSVGGSVGFLGFGASGSYSTSNLNGQSTSYENSDSESLSTGQIEAIAGFLCNGTDNTQASSGALQELSSVIDPNVLAAYNDCLAQSEAGLQVSTTVQGDQDQVTITLSYLPPMGAPDQVLIQNITIAPSNSWECSGPLWNLIQDASSDMNLSNDALGMTCVRNVSSTKFNYLGQSVYARSSTITIFTSAGTLLRSFTPIYASPPVDAVATLTQEVSSLQNSITSLQVDAIATLTQQVSSLQTSITSLQNSALKFDSGLVERGSGDTGYGLATGSGEMQDCSVVQFRQNFTDLPIVTVSLYYLEAETINAEVLVTSVEPTNFTVCAFAWDPLLGYGVSWVALGV